MPTRLIALPLLLLLVLPTLPGCAYLQQFVQTPKVSFQGADFKAADFEKLAVDLKLTIHNPNPLGAQLSGYSMKLVVDGLTLLDGDVDKKLDLSAGATTTLVLPTVVKWEELAKKIGDVASGKPMPDTVPLHASGKLAVITPIGDIAIPYSINTDVPVVAPPLVLPKNVRLGRVTPTSISLEFDFLVRNPTGKDIGLTGFEHALTIQGKNVLSGSLRNGVPVKAHKDEVRTVDLSVGLMELGATVFNLIANEGRVNVKYSGSAKVDTGLGVVPLTFDTTDRLRVGN